LYCIQIFLWLLEHNIMKYNPFFDMSNNEIEKTTKQLIPMEIIGINSFVVLWLFQNIRSNENVDIEFSAHDAIQE
jgi:hypothetical protein